MRDNSLPVDPGVQACCPLRFGCSLSPGCEPGGSVGSGLMANAGLCSVL